MPNAYPAQTNQQRFTFTKIQTASPGAPYFYDVIDGGSSMNSAGFVSSGSGQKIGRIQWDWVTAAWVFVLETKTTRFDINQTSAGNADVLQIKNFIASLAAPVTVNPYGTIDAQQ
jgi:hypothetical protein